jgi:hypothetical protein
MDFDDNSTKTKGWEEFNSIIAKKYKNQNIHYRSTSGNYTYAMLFANHSKNLLVGVFNFNTGMGKVFDRRKKERD